MAKKKNRIYADTSVFGGVFDDEFSEFSSRFFDEVRKGKHIVLISEVTVRELIRAPSLVHQFIKALPVGSVENVSITKEIIDLTNTYIAANVLDENSIDDAAHVAAATVARADAIISWNFKHLVKWDKIRAFNAVNLLSGYPVITILTPQQVISDEKEI